MAFMKSSGKALARLLGKLETEEFYFNQLSGYAVSKFVINPAGNKATAWFKGHVLHRNVQIGELYHCPDGHEYIHTNGKTYLYDPSTDNFYHATV
ncbi:hypothetical protein [Mucilaginibacter phyllosphaerae]|uniref:Fe-S cluster-containing protein n=1 Tax=Mucilaginibacter phyllosphaerae TaxID=1812349 RepID=A0A4Y8AD04_9SPHI|nr:hypothetical protein [Mucilaginibacter phyllosphaerae]MBB3969325.1 putative Fe-S cluster-containing protein [Mucilaginibacter phyllosphaerae]TEW65882.1 hypothetical protein E2R65_12160 [Mucilaginibacter phyllosphaerae]GGH07714.1 hypothetical protein GCM10007352_12570 [Mucilaginibacter phyllosphaerae]